MTYSQLNINQKINFKANAVAYGNAFGTRTSQHLVNCATICSDLCVTNSVNSRIVYIRKAKGGYYPNK